MEETTEVGNVRYPVGETTSFRGSATGSRSRRATVRPSLDADEFMNLLHGSDPVKLELNRLENEVRDKDRELGQAQAEIKALRLSERLREKAVEEMLAKKVDTLTKAMEVEAKKMRREVAAMEKEVAAIRVNKEQDNRAKRFGSSKGSMNSSQINPPRNVARGTLKMKKKSWRRQLVGGVLGMLFDQLVESRETSGRILNLS